MKYTTFLLDIDGLLWNEKPIIGAREKVFLKYGLTPSELEIRESSFIKKKGFYTWGDIFQTLGEDYQELLREHKSHIAPYPGTIPALSAIKSKGGRIAYVTNGPKSDTGYKMERLGIGHFAEIIVTTDDIKAMKPSPKGIWLALEKMGLSKSHAVYLGDSQIDLDTAKNAGIDGFLVNPETDSMALLNYVNRL